MSYQNDNGSTMTQLAWLLFILTAAASAVVIYHFGLINTYSESGFIIDRELNIFVFLAVAPSVLLASFIVALSHFLANFKKSTLASLGKPTE